MKTSPTIGRWIKVLLALTCEVLVARWGGIAPSYAEAPKPAPAPAADAKAKAPEPATTPPQITGAATSNDLNDFQGDKVSFSVDLKTAPLPGQPTVTMLNCADSTFVPAGTTLQGAGRLSDGTQLFTIQCRQHWWERTTSLCPVNGGIIRDCAGNQLTCEADTAICTDGSVVQVPKATLDTFAPDRYGLAYGALVVPFKYQLTGQKEFTGSASLGSYVGYRFDRQGTFGVGLTPMIFAGVGNVSSTKTTMSQPSTPTPTAQSSNKTADTQPTTPTSTSQTSTSNLASFSYGVGLLGVIKGGFQLGAVLGFDHADKGYQYNDKPWIAIQIGYAFSR